MRVEIRYDFLRLDPIETFCLRAQSIDVGLMNPQERLDKKENEMALDAVTDEKENIEIRVPPIVTEDRMKLEMEMLDCLAASKAIFKSQQIDDPELTYEEKRKIAYDLLNKSHSMFLSRFGRFVKREHLDFFEKAYEQDYEVLHHISRLRRFHDNSTRQVDVKNRRYQALKSMIDKGEYFSETEMMRRNPLLYDHLIGRYLTEDQKKERDNLDTQNITFVNLLLESIERDGIRNLKKEQQDAEDEVMEETESDDDSEAEDDCVPSTSKESDTKSKWGELSVQKDPYEKEEKERRMDMFWHQIPSKERQILRDEFVTNMYQSFLDGRDTDFDYSTVDDNESYDNVDLRTQDEEEKYFDAESPETIHSENGMDQDESEEDELDKYMRSLQEQPTPNELAKGVEKQTLH